MGRQYTNSRSRGSAQNFHSQLRFLAGRGKRHTGARHGAAVNSPHPPPLYIPTRESASRTFLRKTADTFTQGRQSCISLNPARGCEMSSQLFECGAADRHIAVAARSPTRFATAVGHRHRRSTLRPAGEPCLAPRTRRRLRKCSNVGIGDDNFVHIQRGGRSVSPSHDYIAKIDVVEGTARAEVGGQIRAVGNTIHPELQ
jgi:hypothetical protein